MRGIVYIVLLLLVLSNAWAVDPPFPTLKPPQNITPALTRGGRLDGFGFGLVEQQTWTPEQRTAYERKVEWFHQAKYGLFFHYLAFGEGLNNFPSPGFKWTSEKWNEWVDAVDVEKFADQVKETGAGYVVLTLGQNHRYACAPNPVLDELWGLEPGQYNSRRDLPMDLARALEKRGIALMLYFAADSQHRLPKPKTWKDEDRFENWLKVLDWYGKHYGKQCKGWWIDGLSFKHEGTKNYRQRLHEVLRASNPDTLIASGVNEISDYLDGHALHKPFSTQERLVRPYWGRWDPEFRIQWHSLQFLGKTWGYPGTAIPTNRLVRYASDVVHGGGVITFDIGMYRQVEGKNVGPYLEIQPDQMAQILAVRDALKEIPVSDGSGQH